MSDGKFTMSLWYNVTNKKRMKGTIVNLSSENSCFNYNLELSFNGIYPNMFSKIAIAWNSLRFLIVQNVIETAIYFQFCSFN